MGEDSRQELLSRLRERANSRFGRSFAVLHTQYGTPLYSGFSRTPDAEALWNRLAQEFPVAQEHHPVTGQMRYLVPVT